MITCTPFLSLCVIAAALISSIVVALPSSSTVSTSDSYNLTLIAENFSWAENLYFDPQGNFFVADFNRGILYRIIRLHKSDTGTPPAIIHEKEVWVSGFKHCAGLAADPTSLNSSLWMAMEASDGTVGVVAVSTQQKNTWTWVSNFTSLPNGLSVDIGRKRAYATLEANFIPLFGKVLSFDATSPSMVSTLAKHLWAADGCFYDATSQLLVVSEVLMAKVLVYNVSTGDLLMSYKAPNMGSLDDFCVVHASFNNTSSRAVLIGADFTGGEVVMFDLLAPSTSGAVVLASGLRNPTSVRVGVGAWQRQLMTSEESSMISARRLDVYVTEGGPLLSEKNDRRVWRLTVPL